MTTLQQITYTGKNQPAGTYALVRRPGSNLARYEFVAPLIDRAALRAQITALITDLSNGTEGKALDERTLASYKMSLQLYASALNGCAAEVVAQRAAALVAEIKQVLS